MDFLLHLLNKSCLVMLCCQGLYRCPPSYQKVSHSVVSNSFRSQRLPIHGILQARNLEWVAIPFSRRSSQSRDNLGLPHCKWILYHLSHQGSPVIRSGLNWDVVTAGPQYGEPSGGRRPWASPGIGMYWCSMREHWCFLHPP